MDALDQKILLRISHELPLKRLLVAGFEKVFDIRAEVSATRTTPRSTCLSTTRWSGTGPMPTGEMGMELTERMIRTICDRTWGTREFTLADGQVVKFWC